MSKTETFKQVRQKEMVKVSKRIQKLLEENNFALYPYTQTMANGATAPRVTIIDTLDEPSNGNEQGTNTEEAGVNQDGDGATESQQA